MTKERLQHHNVTFYTEIGGSILKSVTLAVFVALCANGDRSKMGKKHFSSFFFSPKFAGL